MLHDNEIALDADTVRKLVDAEFPEYSQLPLKRLRSSGSSNTLYRLGEALLEQIHYDETGQLLTGSFMDYAMPRATDMPPITIHNMQTPSPMNSLGAKGVGEAGTIGAPIAILNAAMDALAPFGITDLDMPLTPCKIWHALNVARKGQS